VRSLGTNGSAPGTPIFPQTPHARNRQFGWERASGRLFDLQSAAGEKVRARSAVTDALHFSEANSIIPEWR
jgi:hypothetical protein